MRLSIVVVALLLLTAGACKKAAEIPPAYSGPLLDIPWDLGTLTPPIAGYTNVLPVPLKVSGILVANKITGTVTDVTGHTNVYAKSWQAAIFVNKVMPYISTDGIDSASLNHIMLPEKGYMFLHRDTVGTLWNDSGLNHWYVSGNDSVPAIAADIQGTMPVFTGSMPVLISRTRDFSFLFNGANTANGDSAFVVLCSWNPNNMIRSTIVGTRGGTAVIKASALTTFNNTSSFRLDRSPYSPEYRGGYITLVIYSHEIRTIGGRKIAFVKQREYIGGVNFL